MVVWAVVLKKTKVPNKRQMFLKHQRSTHAWKRLSSAAINKDPIFNLWELGGFGTREGGEKLDGVPHYSGHLDADIDHPVRDTNGTACPRQWNLKKKTMTFFKLDVFFFFCKCFMCTISSHVFVICRTFVSGWCMFL